MKVPRDAFGLRPQAFPRDFHKPPSVCGRFNHYILKNHGITYNNTGSIRDDPYWTSRKNSLELIELSSINKVSLV